MPTLHFVSLQAAKKSNRLLALSLAESITTKLYFPASLKTYGSKIQFYDPIEGQQTAFNLNIDNSFFYFSADLIIKLSKEIQREDTIILDFDIGTLLGFILRFLFFKNKIIHIQIDHKSRRFFGIFRGRIYIKDTCRKLLRRLFSISIKSPLILACNTCAVDEFNAMGFRASFCPLGFDQNMFNLKNEFRTPQDAVHIGYFSRVTREKGFFHFLEGLAQVASQRFVVHVDQSMSELPLNRNQISEIAGGHKINVHNYDYSEIPVALSRLDYLILPSLETSEFSEQYGRLVVEAQAVGTPVITSSSGMLPHLNLNLDLVYAVNSTVDLARVLREVSRLNVIRGAELARKNYERFSTEAQLAEVLRAVNSDKNCKQS